MSENATTGGTPAPARALGDGTVAVPGVRGELRLSESRTRWWNGLLWVPVAESTPWDAIVRDGTWWDGAGWVPCARVLPAALRPLPLSAIHLAVPVLALVVLSVIAGSTTAILLFLILHLGLYFGLVVPSKAMPSSWRAAWFFSVVGLAVLLARAGWRRIGSGATEGGGAHARA